MVKCGTCGNWLERQPWHARRQRVHYCNAKCQHPPMVVKCDWCGGEKRLPPSALRAHNFCDRRCCRAWQGANGVLAKSSRVTLTCPTCGKQFESQPNQIRRVKTRYCSKHCFYVDHGVMMSGEKNPAWQGGRDPYYGPHWKRQAQVARARDGHRCRWCGVSEKELPRKLQVHHIIPLRAFQRDFQRANALANLVSFCSACHKFLEWHPAQMNRFLASWRSTI